MAHRIAVITDSTATLPRSVAEDLAVLVVPVEVIVNGLPYAEGVDISTAAIADALRAGDDISTSRPSPERFLEYYRRAADDGADVIISAHLSGRLSGTCQSAVAASRRSPIPVHVLDSGTVSMGLGFAVAAGAALASEGSTAEEVSSCIRNRAAASRVLFYVDTLQFLRRGGRIGAASALLGSALRMKPILTIAEGQVEPVEKARTSAKALARLGEIAVSAAGDRQVDIAVQDVDTPQRAEDLARLIRARIPLATVSRGSIGAVVGTHVGPGAIAVVVAPRR